MMMLQKANAKEDLEVPMKSNEPPSKEFLVLLKEIVENRILIESLYKSLGASEEEIKEHIGKIEPITKKVMNEYIKDNYPENK